MFELDFIRHQTYLDRYGGGLAERMRGLIDDEELTALVLSGKSVKKRISDIIKDQKKAADKLKNFELNALVRLETKWMKQLFKEIKTRGLNFDDIITTALEKPLVVNNVSVQSFYDTAFNKKEEISQNINQMVGLGVKEQALARAELASSFTYFLRTLDVANKTFGTAAVNELRNQVFQENDDVVNRVVMSATLDGRTTPYCMTIDGEIFPVDEGPRPPFHARCRTVALPVTVGETEEDIRQTLSFRAQLKPGEEYEKGDNKNLRSTKRQIQKGKVDVVAGGSSKATSSSYPEFLASNVHSEEGRQFIQDMLGVKKGNRFIQLVNAGEDPRKFLKDLIYNVDAKNLDLEGLTKKVIKGGGGSGSAPVGFANYRPKTRLEDIITPSLNGTVDLKGASKQIKASILAGLNASVVKYEAKLKDISWIKKRMRAYGVYSSSNQYIQFQKTGITKLSSIQEKQNKIYEQNLELRKSKLKKDINDPARSALKEKHEKILENLNYVKRWSVFQNVDPVKGVAAHEGFHAVYHSKNLVGSWEARFRGFSDADKISVSEYGSRSASELFAEVGTAIELGVEIPKSIFDAFMDVTKEIREGKK